MSPVITVRLVVNANDHGDRRQFCTDVLVRRRRPHRFYKKSIPRAEFKAINGKASALATENKVSVMGLYLGDGHDAPRRDGRPEPIQRFINLVLMLARFAMVTRYLRPV